VVAVSFAVVSTFMYCIVGGDHYNIGWQEYPTIVSRFQLLQYAKILSTSSDTENTVSQYSQILQEGFS
jgi:hypothetical protein